MKRLATRRQLFDLVGEPLDPVAGSVKISAKADHLVIFATSSIWSAVK
jgi:hypothetical protein